MQVKGLHAESGRLLFEQKGQFTGTEQQWQKLIEYYGGNPLALKMVAAATLELFNGRISDVLECIEQGAFMFDDIRSLLERQFNRLSAAEQEVMYWLAIKQEAVSLSYLTSDIIETLKRRQLLQTIKSLLQRSLIEKSGEQFFLQPVVMEYIIQQLEISDYVETQLSPSLPKNINLLLGNTYETVH